MASASEILKAYLHSARTPAEETVEKVEAIKDALKHFEVI